MAGDVFEKFRNVGEKIIGAIVIAALLIANYGVFARFVLEIPVAWTDEILRAIFIWLISLFPMSRVISPLPGRLITGSKQLPPV